MWEGLVLRVRRNANPDQNTLEYNIGRWVGGQQSLSAAQMGMSAEKKGRWEIRSQLEVLRVRGRDVSIDRIEARLWWIIAWSRSQLEV